MNQAADADSAWCGREGGPGTPRPPGGPGESLRAAGEEAVPSRRGPWLCRAPAPGRTAPFTYLGAKRRLGQLLDRLDEAVGRR